MPLYEYSCRRCSERFEVLVLGSETASCPVCQGEDLERLLSVFSAQTKDSAPSRATTGPCGSCGDPRGPGACSMS
jgi:putative FmdB family regulatory protein